MFVPRAEIGHSLLRAPTARLRRGTNPLSREGWASQRGVFGSGGERMNREA
jgi:hypothetical protein